MSSLFEMKARSPVVPLEYPRVTEEQPTVEVGPPVVLDERRSAERAAEQERVVEAAVQRTREETRASVLAECEERMRDDLSVERSAIAHACSSFAQERTRYFAEVEREVVKLAVAIAGRILQREVAMDATLLAGVVRVALSNLGNQEGAVLHVPERELEMWRRAIKPTNLQVKADDEMDAGELRLEAAGGIAELGIGAQLVEIERGFFDLLDKRPA